jgi:glycosyltransferase involved in cell wall biosynthesis
MSPRFSVVIPVYNRARSVLPTLESVRDQTFEDFECIVVDDGSADGEELRAVVEGLADPRFRYVRRENGGGGAARNTGIDEAEGEFLAFLDSDDRWLPEKLQVQSKQLQQFPNSVTYCAAFVDRGVGKNWIRPSRGMRKHEDVGDFLFVSNEFVQTSCIALSAAAARAVRWDGALQKGQDLDFVIRLQAEGYHFQFWPQPLVVWHDVTEAERTSRASGARHSEDFLKKNAHLLSQRARRGFRVTYLAYDLAKERPVYALRDLALGAASGIPLKIILRQFLRAFLPRKMYRTLVNTFVATAGK